MYCLALDFLKCRTQISPVCLRKNILELKTIHPANFNILFMFINVFLLWCNTYTKKMNR